MTDAMRHLDAAIREKATQDPFYRALLDCPDYPVLLESLAEHGFTAEGPLRFFT